MCKKCMPLYRSLKNIRSKREKPYNPIAMQEIIHSHWQQRLPLSFLCFWGAGVKKKPSKTDVRALQQLFERIVPPIQNLYPQGAVITILLANTHAAQNDSSEFGIRKDTSYLRGIKQEARKIGFQTTWLSNLWQQWSIHPPFKNIDGWQNLPPKIQAQLVTMAEKHARQETPIEAAQRYHAMRTTENSHIVKQFPKTILIEFSGSDLKIVLPDMPTIYLRSNVGIHGISLGGILKPWFVK